MTYAHAAVAYREREILELRVDVEVLGAVVHQPQMLFLRHVGELGRVRRRRGSVFVEQAVEQGIERGRGQRGHRDSPDGCVQGFAVPD